MMNDEQLLRYNRHILLPQIDIDGQEAILSARVLVVGVGGLGSAAVMYLAGAGVGELVLVDDDSVEPSNLQRQVIFNESQVGLPKVEAAKQGLVKLNSETNITTIAKRLTGDDLSSQVARADIILDCTDNPESRYLLNSVCFTEKKPLVSGAAIRLEGQLSVFDFRKENVPCYQCLYDALGEQQLSCAESGVLGPVVGIVGVHQALEALKIIAGVEAFKSGRLGLFSGKSGEWRYMNFAKNTNCECCSFRP